MEGIWFSVFIGLVNISSIATNSTNFTVSSIKKKIRPVVSLNRFKQYVNNAAQYIEHQYIDSCL